MKSNKQVTQSTLKSARSGWLTAAGATLVVGIYLQLGACGSNGGSAGTSGSTSTSTNSNTATTTTTTTTTTAATCDVSVQPACPSTAPSYSGEIENIIATYCLQCHDPNGVGAATTTTVGAGGGMPGGGMGNPNDGNVMMNPNFNYDPNFTNSNPNKWDPSDAHDWSKYANIHANATLMEQQVFLCDMPPSGATPMSAADKQTLLNWLACNAPNN